MTSPTDSAAASISSCAARALEWLTRRGALASLSDAEHSLSPHQRLAVQLSESLLHIATSTQRIDAPGASYSVWLCSREVTEVLVRAFLGLERQAALSNAQALAELGVTHEQLERGRQVLELRTEGLAECDASVRRDKARLAAEFATTLLACCTKPQRARTTLLLSRMLRMGLLCLLLVALIVGLILLGTRLLESPDLASGASWRASSAYAGFDPESRVCDGVDTDLLFHTNQEQDPSITYDLGSVKRLSRVEVQNRADCCRERALPLVVDVSTDGEKWREVARQTQAFRSADLSCEPTSARYVRLTARAFTWLHLENVAVR